MMRLLSKLLLTVLFFYSVNSSAGINDACRTKGAAVKASKLTATASTMKVFSTAAIGDVLGTASITGELICDGDFRKNYDFHLQLSLKQGPSGKTICDSNLDGVGIRVNGISSLITCGSWDSFFSIKSPNKNSTYTVNKPNVIEFVKTKESTTLNNGTYSLNYLENITVMSYWPGDTNSTEWGSVINAGPPPNVVVANCLFADAAQEVKFDTVTANQVASGSITRPFNVRFNNCGNVESAKIFNSHANLRFISSSILPDGTLNNDNCPECASGVAIEIAKGNGSKIDLTDTYALSTGEFSFSGDSIVHNFNARLVQSGDVKSGKIHAILVMEITSE